MPFFKDLWKTVKETFSSTPKEEEFISKVDLFYARVVEINQMTDHLFRFYNPRATFTVQVLDIGDCEEQDTSETIQTIQENLSTRLPGRVIVRAIGGMNEIEKSFVLLVMPKTVETYGSFLEAQCFDFEPLESCFDQKNIPSSDICLKVLQSYNEASNLM